jgi:alpha-D-ribose 1-methylphosphonate 5-triphosphate synthase subunit PhnG
VQLADGCTGHSYVAGRSKPHAELAALADALLQSPQGPRWMALVDELEQEQAAGLAARAAQSAATKVDFTTLVRGED